MLEELECSENIAIDDASAVRIVKCPWGQRKALINSWVGQIIRVNGKTYRFGASRHPDWPGLVVQSVGVAGLGKITDTSTNYTFATGMHYSHALLTVTYGPPKYDDENDKNNDDKPEDETFLTQDLDFSADIINVPAKVTDTYTQTYSPFQTITTTREVQQHLRLPTITYKLTAKHVTSPDWAKYGALIGRVNSGVVIKGAIETVLLNGISAKREAKTVSGFRAWEVGFELIYKPNGWNKTLHPETLQWVNMTAIEGSTKPYLSGDIKGLLANL